MSLMRVAFPLFVFLWAVFIMVATSNSDPQAFLYEQRVQFRFRLDPDFKDLLITSDIHLTSEFYLIQKTGHILVFGILYVLHFLWKRNVSTALLLTGIFAAFTEVLQLYFYRSGRIFDVGVDLVGISIAFFISRAIIQIASSNKHLAAK